MFMINTLEHSALLSHVHKRLYDDRKLDVHLLDLNIDHVTHWGQSMVEFRYFLNIETLTYRNRRVR